ncbi:MAG: division/cell wall cluster transcriptional repressor MraZ [gamma proteobacterium symbiont of Bathyaustriella thionipta]|nr:division/cell wall cluster transcriptional repressor MraZ [gamma proteobacterium symbiont of Bathyaustriella thionipta]MCU7948402.1 division/cell wall cluster transcriptional repressor MraZ [gamma proteobacterium symbiont of Bathyaustriella thionipta]MCU7954101.1 division/cell wall cluster transcriptional repressor MraZ [gamma proteobacterium symbiont of Bathyaustriella thionipta]MCU7955394.1 division/cell wall cluster transcriptional repressor MraZ [gamma proteobacterium symbiont of Bathyaus
MLNGVTKLNLDAKGRMAIPSRYRERLVDDCAGHLVITLDTEKRVVIYPHNKWKEVETKLANLPVNKAAVRIQRLYLGHAADCDMDKNGRINIPPYLREITGLNKQVVLVGIGNKFEVWDEDSWNREWQDDEELELPAELGTLSL